MISSIGVAKIITFCFIIVFLKVKLCVSFVPVRRSVVLVGDESPQPEPVGRRLNVSSMLITGSFVDYSANNNHLHQHAFGMSTASHHVRHQHHHVKSQQSANKEEEKVRAVRAFSRNNHSRVAKHHHRFNAHHQSIHNHCRLAPDAGSKTYTRHPNNGNRPRLLHNFVTGGNRSSLPGTPPDEHKTVRPEHGNLSKVGKKSTVNNRVASQRRSHSVTTVSPTPVLQQADKLRNISQNRASNNRTRGTSFYSKRYFQDLLNSYKRNSPYNKEEDRIDSNLMTKSLARPKGKCVGADCRKVVSLQQENDEYDYDYEDDEDDDEDDGDNEEEEEYDDDNSVVGADDDAAADNKRHNGDYFNRKHIETQGDAGYGSMVIVNGSSIQDSHKQTVKRKQSSEGSKHDDNGLDAVGRKDTFSAHASTLSGSSSPQSSMELRKLSKPSHRTDISRLASHHASKIRQEGSCSVPKPKIILASSDPTKQYTPHCTILHRCGDDVGCCPPTQTCASSKNATIELYFFVQTVGARSSIERLSFINHTECACINRLESIAAAPVVSSTVQPTVLTAPNCTCPVLFQRVIDDDNRCHCDCSSSDTQCDQFKRGLEHFSMESRRCILNGRCHEPLCEYGHYSKAKGKCPTREDKLSYSYRG
ncbi:uncharacterized protein LOC129732082 [Wyeomyia smithii]|uniref:uncharacterized protein LOC129732082 n=1 Tax=Wyeomyia smithii TaxID=174621 RepID=UPI002467EE8D|nr:uncharacterized protein LOC129732082 [Wyeomyia smithii]